MKQMHHVPSSLLRTRIRQFLVTSERMPTRREHLRALVAKFAAKRAAAQRFGDMSVGRVTVAHEGRESRGYAKDLGLPGPSSYVGTVWTRRAGVQSFAILEPWVALINPGQVLWLSGQPEAMRVALGILRLAEDRRNGSNRNRSMDYDTVRRLVEIERELSLPRLPLDLLTVARRFVITAMLDGLRGNKGDLKPDLVAKDQKRAHLSVVGDRNSVTLNYTFDSCFSPDQPPIVVAMDFASASNSWFVEPKLTVSDPYQKSRALNILERVLGTEFNACKEIAEWHCPGKATPVLIEFAEAANSRYLN